MSIVAISGREHVVVIDRDELVRWSVAQGLRGLGCSVSMAEETGSALEGPTPAVVLVEHEDPGPDGLAAVDTLRRHHPHAVVILLASEPTPELSRRARDHGVFRVLAKPFSIDTLVATVRRALARAPEPAPLACSDAGY